MEVLAGFGNEEPVQAADRGSSESSGGHYASVAVSYSQAGVPEGRNSVSGEEAGVEDQMPQLRLSCLVVQASLTEQLTPPPAIVPVTCGRHRLLRRLRRPRPQQPPPSAAGDIAVGGDDSLGRFP